MTIVAMWCRHEGDNVIGTGGSIPWSVASDAKHFLDVVAGQTVVCGRKTYESFKDRTLPGCEIFVLTRDEGYAVSDAACHYAVTGLKEISDVVEEKDIYIAGGAVIYDLFMTGKEKLKPQVVVDCVYDGEMESLAEDVAEISVSVKALEKNYRRISPFYCQDGVKSAIYLKKGEFVEQKVLKRIVEILEQNAFLA